VAAPRPGPPRRKITNSGWSTSRHPGRVTRDRVLAGDPRGMGPRYPTGDTERRARLRVLGGASMTTTGAATRPVIWDNDGHSAAPRLQSRHLVRAEHVSGPAGTPVEQPGESEIRAGRAGCRADQLRLLRRLSHRGEEVAAVTEVLDVLDVVPEAGQPGVTDAHPVG
jgi:hypothetical protein